MKEAYRKFMREFFNVPLIRTEEQKAKTLEAIDKGVLEGRTKAKKK